MPDGLCLATIEAVLTPADHQTHRRYPFDVPPGCTGLHVEVRYGPKYLAPEDSRARAEAAIGAQAASLASRLDAPQLTRAWTQAWTAIRGERRIANLLTVSLDDTAGAYRGAGHRHAPEQHLTISPAVASPGLVAGPLPAGQWQLTLSVHTLVSGRCDVRVQIGAEMASSAPSAERSTA